MSCGSFFVCVRRRSKFLKRVVEWIKCADKSHSLEGRMKTALSRTLVVRGGARWGLGLHIGDVDLSSELRSTRSTFRRHRLKSCSPAEARVLCWWAWDFSTAFPPES